MRAPEMLLIPGPVSVSPDVLSALGRPVAAHYGDDWVEMYRGLTTALAGIFATQGDVVLLAGPGSAALETCLASTLAPGDEVLMVTNGLFGERFADIARALGLTVHPVTGEPLRAMPPERLARAIDEHPGARAFAVVHHETSLGLLNPVDELCRLASDRGLLTIVDAIASVAGIPLEMDAWGIDLCAGTANKCLGAPPGISPVAVGPGGWAAVDDGRRKAAGWYLNLATWRRYSEMWGGWHPTPTTMPSGAVSALETAVKEVLARGLEAHQARFRRAAWRVREGLAELGFEMVIPDEIASPVTTAVWGLHGMDIRHYIAWLRDERGLRLGGGLGELAGTTFRVGHMGRAADPDVVDAYLRATAQYLALTR